MVGLPLCCCHSAVNDSTSTDCNLVVWLPSRERSEFIIVNGPDNLVDIEIVAPEVKLVTTSVPQGSQDADDPAILSYGRPPQKHDATLSSTHARRQPSTTTTAAGFLQTGLDDPVPIVGQEEPQLSSTVPQQASQNSTQHASAHDHASTYATLTEPFEELTLNDGYNGGDDNQQEEMGDGKDSQAPIAVAPKHKRRRPKRGIQKERLIKAAAERIEAPQQGDRASPGSRRKLDRQQKTSGWRETPFLEEAPKPKKQSLHPFDGSMPKGRRHRQRKANSNETNGWATEDATDIQDMGDFDFSGNLSKFDKLGTFNQFKQEDTTADEERLVTHNRVPPRPGTAGGKNLHYTENVLDSPKVDNRATWNSDDSENDLTEAKIGSGRSSHRNASRASIRQPPSRKSSVITSEQHMTGSGSLPESKARIRVTPRQSINGSKILRDISSSRNTIKRTILHSEKTTFRVPSSAHSKPSFRLTNHGHVCPCLTPLQMLELEQLAITELGLTEDIVTENAARAIAETAPQLIDLMEVTPNTGGPSASPAIVILAGNNKSGARAIAGARQALNHHSRLFLTVLGLERDDDLLDAVRRQLSIFRNCGGQVIKPDRLIKSLKTAHTTPDLIIDALLGMHMAFDDLRADDQATYFGLASWANKTAPIMAIDVPSGLDASSGKSLILAQLIPP